MQVGVNLINFGPGASSASLLQWAKIAEDLGYHSAMISDHVALTADVRIKYPEPFYDAFATLSWLAGQTKRIKLGTTVVVVPYRHPALLARLGANLDDLSGGRFILGVGVGGMPLEYAALGLAFHERGAIANEYLAAIKVLWTSETASFQGKHVAFTDVAGIRSLQRPHPPIWVGGRSDAALRRAVRFGDAWHPNHISLEWLRTTGLPRIRTFAERAGRPVPALAPRIAMGVTDAALPEHTRQVGHGRLDQVRRDVEALHALGATHLLLDRYTGDLEATRDHEAGWRTLELLAGKVFDLKRETLR